TACDELTNEVNDGCVLGRQPNIVAVLAHISNRMLLIDQKFVAPEFSPDNVPDENTKHFSEHSRRDDVISRKRRRTRWLLIETSRHRFLRLRRFFPPAVRADDETQRGG